MATGPEHYFYAEELLKRAEEGHLGTMPLPNEAISRITAGAQVHATLALAAATALHGSSDIGQPIDDDMAWRRVAATTRTTAKDSRDDD